MHYQRRYPGLVVVDAPTIARRTDCDIYLNLGHVDTNIGDLMLHLPLLPSVSLTCEMRARLAQATYMINTLGQ